MKNLLPLILSVCFFSFNSFAQNLTLYQNEEGQRYTQPELDTLLSELQRKFNKLDMVARARILEEKVTGDTLVKIFELDISSRVLVEKEEKREAFIGQPLPAFTLKDLEGRTVTAADLKGKITLINFWFTRCAPCIAEMPALNELREDYPPEDYQFIALAPENAEEIRAFLQKRAFNFRHLHSAEPFIEQFSGEYPLNVLLDAEGTVRHITGGLASLNAETGKHEVDAAPLRELLDALGK